MQATWQLEAHDQSLQHLPQLRNGRGVAIILLSQWCRTGGGAGGATAPPLLKVGAVPPPLFGHVCTLNERKGLLIQYVSHKC